MLAHPDQSEKQPQPVPLPAPKDRERTQPKHLGKGLAKGAWSVVKGVGVGAGTLVAAPVAGAVQGGGKGFVAGLGVGVVAAVAAPVAGVCVGVKQVGQGALNTPEAFRNIGKETRYDKKSGKWVPQYQDVTALYNEVQIKYVSYMDHRKEVECGIGVVKDVQTEARGAVVDTEFYETLNVPPTATAAQIRKAYYTLAMECHPDKNPGDASAKERFQRIGEAYQVLGDEERRARYDKNGKTAEIGEFIDCSTFFTILFGSEHMEPFTGKLQFAQMAEDAELMEKDPKFYEENRDVPQIYRTIKLAVELRERLSPLVIALENGDEKSQEQYIIDQTEICRDLCKKSFGPQLLEIIGFAYEMGVKDYFGEISKANVTDKYSAKFQKKNRRIFAFKHAVTSAVAAQKSVDSDELKAVQHMVEAVLSMCLIDVQDTVVAVAQCYLGDSLATEIQRKEFKPAALKMLGKLYQKIAGGDEFKNQDIMAFLQEAMARTTGQTYEE